MIWAVPRSQTGSDAAALSYHEARRRFEYGTLVPVKPVVFEYRLTGAGWFEALFRVGDAQLDVTLGDQPQPLEELMRAALALARDEALPPQLLWDPEDGMSYRWDLRRQSEHVQIRVGYVDQSASWPGPQEDSWPVSRAIDLCPEAVVGPAR